MAVLTLWKKGCSKSEIARKLNLNRKTVRRAIKRQTEEGRCNVIKRVQGALIEPYHE